MYRRIVGLGGVEDNRSTLPTEPTNQGSLWFTENEVASIDSMWVAIGLTQIHGVLVVFLTVGIGIVSISFASAWDPFYPTLLTHPALT